MPRRLELTGQVFGRLMVIGLDHISDTGDTYWLCECSCSNKTRVVVKGHELKRGHIRSCGCMRLESNRKRLTTHGMTGTSLYNVWCSMRQRCKNENDQRYADYGGRGITVCTEWNKFENFRDWAFEHGYSEGLTLDREDNDKGYCPENCRWVDDIIQQNNKRNNHYFTYEGTTKTLSQWAKCFGMNHSTLLHRMEHGDLHDFEKYFNINGEHMSKFAITVGTVKFDDQYLDVYSSLDEPLFKVTDIAKMIGHSEHNTTHLLELCELDERLHLPIIVSGHKRYASFVTETGLYNILSKSRKPLARKWIRVILNELVRIRKEKGIDIVEQFEEWDRLLDTLYLDEETGLIMQSVTVAGGDVDQIPYDGPDITAGLF